MPALTDAGLCHVLHGSSIVSTYNPTKRIQGLDESFGFGDDFSRLKNISGSGFLNQKTFMFDVGIRYNNIDFRDNKCLPRHWGAL